MKGIRYLYFVGDMYQAPESVREKRIAEYSADLGITEVPAEKAVSYSHGMRQKPAFVAALMHEPKFLIMDKPFVSPDPKAAFILNKFMCSFC